MQQQQVFVKYIPQPDVDKERNWPMGIMIILPNLEDV
jgi:hypothetical protein